MRGGSQDDHTQCSIPADSIPSNPDAKSKASQDPHAIPEPTLNPRKSLAESLLTRCNTLLTELDAFKALLSQTQRNPQIVEVRSLRSNILAELKTLEKISGQLDAAIAVTEGVRRRIRVREQQGGNSDGVGDGQYQNELIDAEEAEIKLMHTLRSSNLPFYEAVWTIAKRTCTGLVAFGKRFYWDGEQREGSANKNKDKRKSVFVDIVADDGEEWVKVSTISETRLLFEMAKKGWEGDSEDEDEDREKRTVLQNHSHGSGSDYDDEDEDDDDEIELIKLASDMRKAASLVRVNYKQPRLRFVIPKVEEGQTPEIDDLLKAIRGYGVIVNCGEDVSSSEASGDPRACTVSIEEEVRNLLPNRFKRFTSTVNIDCTLLLAIISDLSHYQSISPSPRHHKAINRQIEIERERPLLPTELWPAMESRELICTSEAAKRMREIVDIIGTETERTRMAILMGDNSCSFEPSHQNSRCPGCHRPGETAGKTTSCCSKSGGNIVRYKYQRLHVWLGVTINDHIQQSHGSQTNRNDNRDAKRR